MLPDFPGKRAVEVVTISLGTVGGWSLSGFLAGLASLVAIVVGVMHIYDWVKAKRNKPYSGEGE